MKIEELKKTNSDNDEVRKSCAAEVEKLKKECLAPEEIEAIKEKIKTANETNADVQRKTQKAEKQKILNTKSAEAERLTKNIADRNKQKDDAIEKADMPVKGLSLSNGGVYFNNVPFAQASSAEQLRISTAIAMAANPKLRVIRIKDGGLLDENGFAEIKKMAKERDYQLWIETVHTTDPLAIIIEEGEVKGAAESSEQ